jgi:hypothetical protein
MDNVVSEMEMAITKRFEARLQELALDFGTRLAKLEGSLPERDGATVEIRSLALSRLRSLMNHSDPHIALAAADTILRLSGSRQEA